MREDAEIIAWRCKKNDLTSPLPTKGPFAIDKTIRYVPRIVTPRLRAQRGLFTVHPKPREEFNLENEKKESVFASAYHIKRENN
jgi:hypothetical protein